MGDFFLGAKDYEVQKVSAVFLSIFIHQFLLTVSSQAPNPDTYPCPRYRAVGSGKELEIGRKYGHHQ